MGLESYDQQDIQKYLEFAMTPEGEAIVDHFVLRAIVHEEYPEPQDPDSAEQDPSSYRMMRIVRAGTAKLASET